MSAPDNLNPDVIVPAPPRHCPPPPPPSRASAPESPRGRGCSAAGSGGRWWSCGRPPSSCWWWRRTCPAAAARRSARARRRSWCRRGQAAACRSWSPPRGPPGKIAENVPQWCTGTPFRFPSRLIFDEPFPRMYFLLLKSTFILYVLSLLTKKPNVRLETYLLLYNLTLRCSTTSRLIILIIILVIILITNSRFLVKN